MHHARFHISKMDCPSEENLIKLKLQGFKGEVNHLEFNLEGEMEDLNKEVGRLEESVEEFKQAQVQGVYLAQQAALELAKKESFWSDFFTVLKRETPSGVRILSYSGSEGGKISISATAETFDQLASMIKNLNSALEFKDVFVASVSKGTSGEGRTVLSFPISLEYQFLPAKTLPVKKSRKRVKE